MKAASGVCPIIKAKIFSTMTEFQIYKLHFTSPLHIGDSRADYGVSLRAIQSDTLYAAVTACLAKTGEHIPDNGDLKCTISSLFPFKEDTLFLPKPLNYGIPEKISPENLKLIKKAAWLDVKYFEAAIHGKNIFPENDTNQYIDGEYMADNIENKRPEIQSSISPRVSVARDGQNDAVPFYMDRIHFKSGSGLYFIATGDTTLLEIGLNILQNEGIGTDRNVGNGFFTIEKDKLSLNVPDRPGLQMCMSSFIPEDNNQLGEMLIGDNISYDIARRGGWITTFPYNSYRKKYVYSFLPASVFSGGDGTVSEKGTIINLRPDIPQEPDLHNIWRCGRALFIPILPSNR